MIKDIVKTQSVGDVRIPDLKGEVCIQLFNAKTGELEQEVRGENMVTNAVKDIFAANYLGKIDYSKLMPIATTLYGGVLCYNKVQTENASNYYPPMTADNEIIAHAGQTTYGSAAADSTRGEPNDGLSGVVPASGSTPIGYRLVWTFDESQANDGTIRSVSLTHKDFGDWAWKGGKNFNPIEVLSTTSIPDAVKTTYFYNETKREAYKFSRNDSNNKVIMYAYADTSKKSTIGLTQKYQTENPYSANVLATVEVDVTDAGASYVLFLESTQKVHILYPHGNTIDRTIIDLTDFSKTTSNLTTEYNNLVAAGQGGNYRPRTIELDDDGYIYLPVTDGVVKQNYTTMNDYEHITGLWAEVKYHPTMGIGHHGFLPIPGNVDDGGLGIVDGDTVYRCYGAWNESIVDYNRGNCNRLGKAPIFFRDYYRGGYGDQNLLVLWKPYLATIFNLSTAINKTAQQTMTITYTLTEAASNS